MDSIEDDVEDERETEGSPANSQPSVKSGGCDDSSFSITVYHSDSSSWDQYQGRHCQTKKINEIIFTLENTKTRPDLKRVYNGVVTQLPYKL